MRPHTRERGKGEAERERAERKVIRALLRFARSFRTLAGGHHARNLLVWRLHGSGLKRASWRSEGRERKRERREDGLRQVQETIIDLVQYPLFCARYVARGKRKGGNQQQTSLPLIGRGNRGIGGAKREIKEPISRCISYTSAGRSTADALFAATL